MRRVIGMVTAVAVLATGCTDDAPGDAGASRGEREPAGTSEQPLGIGGGSVELPEDLLLVSFDACADYHDYITARALELVGPYGLDGGGGHWFEDVAVDEVDDGDAEMAVEDSAGAPAADEISGTNVQEVGVDEPDIVKTDGATMYVVAQGLLRVLDIRGDEPRELATLELAEAWDARLLLDGDHLLVTSSSPIGIPFAGERITSSDWGWGWGTTTIVRVDVSDPSAPRVAERLTIDGSTVSSRLVDGVARVVVRTEQGDLPWVYPEGSGLRAERRATEANRELIRNSEPEDWIPYFVHRTADGQEREGPALACDRIARPSVFSGLGVLSVLTIDLDGGGLIPGDEAVGVLTGGDTVYASPERLYVGTTSWVDWDAMGDRERQRRGRELTTAIHAFDTSDPGRTDYLASGEVPGTLLSQWAMSEHVGRLGVASTAGDPWGWGGGSDSQSYVTVLEPIGDVLAQVGQVGGLGPTETIHAVRFIGDIGYVVTFRQTDPLYTVDLTDPTDPVVRGELKILGYSAYLHPVADGLLLGVGQDADEQGMLKGTQLSLFDVSDLDDPIRIDTVELGQGGSEVEHDHHAFLHWPATGLTVVPFTRWTWDETGHGDDEVLSGAATFTADRDRGIDTGRVLTHTAQLEGAGEVVVDGYELDVWDLGWFAQIRRSVVVGDRLLTVSEAGVAVHDLATLEDLGWARFQG
jgi:hypothetical protein